MDIFLWENKFITQIEEEITKISPPFVHQGENPLPPKRIIIAMDKSKKIQEEKEKEKEARAPTFRGFKRKSRKSSNSSVGIDPHQKLFYDNLLEREQINNTPIFNEPQDDNIQEDIVVDNIQEDVAIPGIPVVEIHSPTPYPNINDEQKYKKKIKNLKKKMKTLKVLDGYLKNENILIKERNQTLVSENDKLKEDQHQPLNICKESF